MIANRLVRAAVTARIGVAIVLFIAFGNALTASGAPGSDNSGSASAVERDAADRAVIERILADWRARAEKLGTLHCVAEGTCLVPKGCYNGDQYLPEGTKGDVPPDDYTHACSYDWLFDFKNARFRIEEKNAVLHMEKLVFVPDVQIRVCDGLGKPSKLSPRDLNTCSEYAPHANQPDLYINIDSPTLVTPDLIVLLAHGTVPPIGRTVWSRDIGATLSSAKDFNIHGHVELDDRGLIVLRSIGKRPTDFDEYWVDESRQSAIVHWESRAGRRKIFAADVAYRQVASLWLPHTINYTKFTARPKNPPEVLCRMEVTEIQPNAPVTNDAFKVKPIEGMIVWDGATNKSFRFTPETTGEYGAILQLTGLLTVLLLIGAVLWRRGRARSEKRSM